MRWQASELRPGSEPRTGRGVRAFAPRFALLAAACLSAPGFAQTARPGVWISREEVLELPASGPSWDALHQAADYPLPRPELGERDSNCDVLVMARALVFARTDDQRYRTEVVEAVQSVMGSEKKGDVLALARNLAGYVIAADLVVLPPVLEKPFKAWLRLLPDEELQGMTLRGVHERRPNNWGLHAGGARAVIARYLDDAQELERVAQIFRGWLGERSSYAGFEYGALDWQADPLHPVGINPRGALRDGHSIDGVLPDDQRRSGGFVWPPPKENYVYEALQGALLQAVVLARAGYDPWSWGDRALLRAGLWLEHQADFPAEGDDTWEPYVLNHFYDASLRVVRPARPGKNVGWTDWTLAPHKLR